jgi:hypothetical protein
MRAKAALAYIRLLYDVEDQAKELPPDQRAALRREKSLPRLQEFRAWLESRQAAKGGPVLPKSPMGAAITYAFNQWDALCVYTTDGDLAIDNNASERALRRIAVGRGYVDHAVMRNSLTRAVPNVRCHSRFPSDQAA